MFYNYLEFYFQLMAMCLWFVLQCVAIKNDIKDTLLEIRFIEEMKTTSGNKEVPQTFFPNSLYS